ncbi:MAG: metallophosphoesterase [Bryobacteraceae bacterium]
MRNHSLLTRLAWLAITAVVLAGAAAGQDSFAGVDRVVAIGDIHGDYEAFAELLRAAALIDGSGKWTGGKSHLVQTGDVVDRGADTRHCLDLLMALEKQARQAGGRIHALIGNHEAMNLYGDFRYVSAGEYASYRTGKSERVRDMYYEQHARQAQQGAAPGAGRLDEEYRRKWLSSHPLGFFERMIAMAPDGHYGKWIVNNRTAVKINDMVFLHGGISPKYAKLKLQELNRKVREELLDRAKLEGGMVMDPEGPFWWRGLAQDDERKLETHLNGVLERLEASCMIVGHTVTKGYVTPRFDGRVLLLDTGISRSYGSRPACLLVESGRRFAIHRGAKILLPRNMGTDLLRYQDEVEKINRGVR